MDLAKGKETYLALFMNVLEKSIHVHILLAQSMNNYLTFITNGNSAQL